MVALEAVHLAQQRERLDFLGDEYVDGMRPIAGRVLVDQRMQWRPVFGVTEHHAAHRSGGSAVVKQHLGDDGSLEAALDQAKPEVPVFASLAHAFVVPADRVERRAPDECRAVHRVARQHRR